MTTIPAPAAHARNRHGRSFAAYAAAQLVERTGAGNQPHQRRHPSAAWYVTDGQGLGDDHGARLVVGVERAGRGGAAANRPAAIILGRVDPVLVIGSLVAADLYNIEVPIVIVDEGDWHQLAEARHAVIDGRENLLRLS